MQSPDGAEPTLKAAVDLSPVGHGAPDFVPSRPVILRDGTSAWLRPVSPEDGEKLSSLFARASPESRALRFFAAKRAVSPNYIEGLVLARDEQQLTLVVSRDGGSGEEVLGVASLITLPPGDRAEVAFFVDDANQGNGIGTICWINWPNALIGRGFAHSSQTCYSPTRRCWTRSGTAAFTSRRRSVAASFTLSSRKQMARASSPE